MDQPVDRRTFGGIADRLVDSIPHCEKKQRREGGRHREFLQPALGNRRANCHRLPGFGPAILRLGVWGVGTLSGGWDCGIRVSAWQD